MIVKKASLSGRSRRGPKYGTRARKSERLKSNRSLEAGDLVYLNVDGYKIGPYEILRLVGEGSGRHALFVDTDYGIGISDLTRMD